MVGALSELLALLAFRATFSVRRAERRSAMATATKQSRAARQLAGRALDARMPASMEFLIFEDNGGSYHWTIVARDGATLARSGSLGSYEDAERAAQHVRNGVASALFERRGDGARPVDLIARRDASRDAADAERWLDEGGSFSSEAVAKWPAPR
jgi:uncharacterized protein YegP (UPF0339 family)